MYEDNKQLTDIINFFREIVAQETSSTLDDIGIDNSFHSLGLDSINAVFVLDKLEIKFKVSLPPLLFWDYPTIHSFSEHIQTLINDA